MALAEQAAETGVKRRWLAIVGIGEDGAEGLGTRARDLIREAEVVFGGARHLALAASLVRGAARPWPSPFDSALAALLAERGRRVCVLASGDPFLFGVGSLIAKRVGADEIDVVPAPSSFSLAAARMGWALPQVALVSVHGRSLDLLRPHLQPGARVLALTSDAGGPGAVAALLRESGFGATRLTVLEALGGPRERVRGTRADAFGLPDVQALNLVALDVEAGPGARVLPRAAGLDDAMFENDGQLTKREVRAVTLSSLSPRRGELLWDIGAGSGSVAIEWMLADTSLKAVAVETNAERAERIRRNAARCGVPGLRVVEGRAPEALAGLPVPDAIFVGGGASDAGVLDAALSALRAGGRLVANGITLETEALLIARHAALGGDLVQVAVARAKPLGGMTGWEPARPVVQWRWGKP